VRCLAASGDHLRGVLQAGLGHFGAAQHARHFVSAGAVVQNPDARRGAPILLALFDRQMLIGEGGDLGQMRDAQNLLRAAESLQFVADGFGGASVRGVVFFFDLDEDSSTATLRASSTRESSPPEAISISGLRGSPGLGESR